MLKVYQRIYQIQQGLVHQCQKIININRMNDKGKQRFFDSDSDNEEYTQSNNQNEQLVQQDYHILPLVKQSLEGDIEPDKYSLQVIASNNKNTSFICILGEKYQEYAKVANLVCEISGTGFLDDSVKTNGGIWIYSKPYFNPKSDSLTYFILAKESRQQPLTALTLSLLTLISSSIIYVVSAPLGKDSLKTISQIDKLPQTIILNSKIDNSDIKLDQLMPIFNWILLDNNEKQPLRNETLSQFLLGNSDATKQTINMLLTKGFTICIKDTQEQRLEKQSLQISSIRKKNIFSSQVKNIQGCCIQSGSVAALVLQRILESIKMNQLIILKDVLNEINEILTQEAYQSAINEYIRKYQQNFDKEEPKGEELYDILRQMKEEAIYQFDMNTGKISQNQRRRLLSFLEIYQKQIVEANTNACQIHNLKILNKISKQLSSNVQNQKYTSKNVFDSDFEQFVRQYKKKSLGPHKNVTLQKFISVYKTYFQDSINKNSEKCSSLNESQAYYERKAAQDLVFSLGAPPPLSSVENKQEYHQIKNLQEQVQELEQQLAAKKMRNSMLLKTKQQRLQLQNQRIRKQMMNLQFQKKGKSQKCCLLF